MTKFLTIYLFKVILYEFFLCFEVTKNLDSFFCKFVNFKTFTYYYAPPPSYYFSITILFVFYCTLLYYTTILYYTLPTQNPYISSFLKGLSRFVTYLILSNSLVNGKIYSSVGRKYNTGPIFPSDGQIAQFIFWAIRPSWRKIDIQL